jgi:hypothetical protein
MGLAFHGRYGRRHRRQNACGQVTVRFQANQANQANQVVLTCHLIPWQHALGHATRAAAFGSPSPSAGRRIQAMGWPFVPGSRVTRRPQVR